MPLRIFLIIGSIIWLVACTGSAETPAGQGDASSSPAAPPVNISLDNEQIITEGGYAFRPVTGWSVETRSGITTISPPTTTSETGPSLVLTTGALKDLNVEGITGSSIASSTALFDALLKSLDFETASLTLETPREVTIGGQPGQVVRFRSQGFGNLESEATGQIAAALLDEGRAFVILGLASPPETWQVDAEFTAMLESVRFVE